ncbi:MAG: CDP-glycerol glycerophosphotransferase family protein [Thermoleophilaceae bacterium]|nr:CDP-glycerol glycerophosphotransferase family protein [Thermoleophilaceae bacterium]
MRALRVELRIRLVRVGHHLGARLPLQRRVVLATAHAPRIGGNLVAIRDEIARRHPGVRITVVADSPGGGIGGKLRAATAAVVAGYLLARARLFIVDDYFFPVYVVQPRRGTRTVQVWHASGAFKKMGHSLTGKTFGADAALRSRVRIHANYDICLISSRAVLPHYAEAFDQPPERFISHIGIPRTDRFFDADAVERASAEVRTRYRLPSDRRVILYAPTFRGDRITDARHSDDLNLHALRRDLSEDHIVLVRLHPFVRARPRIGPELAGFVHDVSDHPDINALMLVSDLLVTDYSSAIFEFSLLGRPMAFFAPDLDAYERERGFYFDYRSGVPGPVFTETDALARWIREGPVDLERIRRFRDASFEIADGQASRRFVDEVVIPALRSGT